MCKAILNLWLQCIGISLPLILGTSFSVLVLMYVMVNVGCQSKKPGKRDCQLRNWFPQMDLCGIFLIAD